VSREARKLAATPPQERTAPPAPRWTLKRLPVWLQAPGQDGGCREPIRQALQRLGVSWKKARNRLNRAAPDQRAALLEKLKPVLRAATRGQHALGSIDQAHVRQETDEGAGGSSKGARCWVRSSAPPLGATGSCSGVYCYHQGRVKRSPYERATSETPLERLEPLRRAGPERPLTGRWDGASSPRPKAVLHRAAELQRSVLPVSASSPDFMPVEPLWQWVREDVTYHPCYHSREEVSAQLEPFQPDVNATPDAIADRLWVKTHLDPEEEKLRISK
jgi:transposase